MLEIVTLNHPTLSDYNDLICLGIGLCLAYIFIASSRKRINKSSDSEGVEQFFFKFLDDFASSSIDKIATHKLIDSNNLGSLSSQIGYYLDTGKLQSETKGSFQDILYQLNKIKANITELENKSEKKIQKRTEAKHLGKISFMLALYGIFILFIAGAEIKYNLNILPSLFISALLIISGFIVCIVSEYDLFKFKLPDERSSNESWKNKFKRGFNSILFFFRKWFYPNFKRAVFYFLFIPILFFILCYYQWEFFFVPKILYNEVQDPIMYPLLLYSTLCLFFAGFIVYLFYSFLAVNRCVGEFKKQIRGVKAEEQVKGFQDMVNTHKLELDKIDSGFNETPIIPVLFTPSESFTSSHPDEKIILGNIIFPDKA